MPDKPIDGTAPPLVDLDRQDASSSQGLLGALFVEYSFGDESRLSSTDIIAVLQHFGVTESASRSALSRTVKRGTLALHRGHGDTAYSLTENARLTQHQKLSSVLAFGSDSVEWDDQWTACIFTVPEEHRASRQRFRSGLIDLGYGSAVDGVWMSPWDRRTETRRLAELHSIEAILLRGPVDSPASFKPSQGYALGELHLQYTAFLEHYGPIASTRLQIGDVRAQALKIRTGALRDWRRIAAADPQLPLDVLPRNWPRPAAYRAFRQIWDGLEEAALERLKEILRKSNPQAALRVSPVRSVPLC